MSSPRTTPRSRSRLRTSDFLPRLRQLLQSLSYLMRIQLWTVSSSLYLCRRSPPTSPSLSLPSTPSFASPNAGNVPEVASVSSPDPRANPTPLPSMFPVLPASSELPPASLSPSLALDDLELESTPASIVNSDTIPLSSPGRPPLSSSDIVPQLPPPLKFSLSIPVSPHRLSTVLTPPGLLKLSPNVPVTPPSLSPLEATGLTPVGPIFSPLEALPVSTPLENSPSAPSTQLARHMSIPVNSTFTSLQIVPSRSPSLSLPSPGSARVNFALPFPISAISVSDLVKALSAHAHEFRSKRKDFAGSKSDAAKPRNPFAYRFQLEQYTPRSLSFVFDPGGIVLVLDPTHEDFLGRNPRTRGVFTIASSITVPSFAKHKSKVPPLSLALPLRLHLAIPARLLPYGLHHSLATRSLRP
ncbi:hypothetical protein EDB85DRAFT_583297 [Lactarius pseudohatsudake]|nr:hypothetical protein EDB85DRAFT_583297 [Lactarius pseudohatsudake]